MNVSSEIGTLRRVFIHAPDDGIGKIFPSKAQDWLYEDIIDLHAARRNEYQLFIEVLLCFLDKKFLEIDENKSINYTDPKHENYFRSEYVIDLQWLLSDILEMPNIRAYVVSAVCANESVSYKTFENLLTLTSRQLANTIISGSLPCGTMIFPPIPNFMMTRDVAIVINDHILVSRPAKQARQRESTIMRFIVHNHPFFGDKSKIIDLEDDETYFLLDAETKESCRKTLEGGDLMMVAPNHLLIGISERTTMYAAQQLTKILQERNIVDKVTFIKLPSQRYCMHLDTVVTHIKKNMWVIFSPLCKNGIEQCPYNTMFQKETDIQIWQYVKGNENPLTYNSLEDLLIDISKKDLHCNEPVQFVMSGHGKFPETWREQWTDGCNVFAIKEGVVITYDRNRGTIEAFKQKGMQTIQARDLVEKVISKEINPEDVKDTVITLPSAELSRARGGTHCMTQPILRNSLD